MFRNLKAVGGDVEPAFSMQQVMDQAPVIETLHSSEARFITLFDTIDQGVIYIDGNGLVVSANHAAELILGLPVESIKGRRLIDACSKVIREDGSAFPHEHQPPMLALRTGKPVENVILGLFNSEKKNYSWVISTSVPVFESDQQQQPHQVLMTMTDITRRKLNEETLNLASVIVNNTGEGMFVTDHNRKIISVNGAFTAITGFTQQDVTGRKADFLQARKDPVKIANGSGKNHAGKDGWQGEVWHRRKYGPDFPSWITVSEVKDSNGRLTHYVYVFMDITHLKKVEDRLGFLAYHDPLTKLPNRMLLKDRIDHALQNAQRGDSKVAVLFLDLDRFKNINDNHGHDVGDSLLREVAKRIKNLVRQEDTVSRYSGDEFIVLMEDVSDARNPATLAQKLIDAFEAPFSIKQQRLQVSASIGISLFPKDGRDTETLIKNADAAMYRAKKESRNNFQYYNPELTTDAFEKIGFDNALRQSIVRNELVLYYQPRISLKTGKLVGVESLVRWQHPARGLILPLQFISLAEESGFIMALGEWVLQTACMQMRRWLDEGLPMKKMVVNISAAQFLRSDFVATIDRALRMSGLEPACLELEITESSFMENSEQTVKSLSQLCASGIDMTIDDFGMGCFSFNKLKRTPVKKLKIDRSFVKNIANNTDDESIARSVIALGHSLNLQVVAEGIESEVQQKLLRELGCDEGQGYLYSPPVLSGSEVFRQLAL
ncbi:MAG: EAL domain-containing protein [Methylobacter sp.]|nr:EAL domain-containing protein [Methylobacter sp.]